LFRANLTGADLRGNTKNLTRSNWIKRAATQTQSCLGVLH